MAKTFVCIGHDPVPGCGRVLTDEERHYYGTACEECERRWSEIIEAWHRGEDNPELDAMFDVRPALN